MGNGLVEQGWIISLVEAQYLTTADVLEFVDYVAPVVDDLIE